jgi:hypothetical protein
VNTRDDAYWALAEHGRYVIAASETGQAVFRLAHQQLIDIYRHSEGQGLWRRVSESVAARVTTTLVEVYRDVLSRGVAPDEHQYLWRYLWRQAADGGPEGIASLEELAATNPAFLNDLAMSLNNVDDY